MDMENKEEILQPVNEEELEAAAGGRYEPRVLQYFSCKPCGYVGPTRLYNEPICPKCGARGEFFIRQS